MSDARPLWNPVNSDLALESSWLFLASSYELSERLSAFTNEADLKKNE